MDLLGKGKGGDLSLGIGDWGSLRVERYRGWDWG